MKSYFRRNPSLTLNAGVCRPRLRGDERKRDDHPRLDFSNAHVHLHAVSQRIAIECLTCGHCGSLAAAELARFGLQEDASLVVLSRRLVCQECGSRSTRAFRYDPDGPPLAPE